jgi:hypothetical protein
MLEAMRNRAKFRLRRRLLWRRATTARIANSIKLTSGIIAQTVKTAIPFTSQRD